MVTEIALVADWAWCHGSLPSFVISIEVDVGKDQEFTVKSKGAGGQGKVASKIVGPSGASVPCKVELGLGADNSVVRFVPREEGPYEVEVTYDGVPVPGSPFPLEAVSPTKPSKVIEVWGLPHLFQTCHYPLSFVSLWLMAVARSVCAPVWWGREARARGGRWMVRLGVQGQGSGRWRGFGS